MNKEVKKLVENSRSSLDFLNKKSNKKINSIIKLIEKEILNKEVNYKLSEMAVKETGFGNIQLLAFFLIILTLRRNSYGK